MFSLINRHVYLCESVAYLIFSSCEVLPIVGHSKDYGMRQSFSVNVDVPGEHGDSLTNVLGGTNYCD